MAINRTAALAELKKRAVVAKTQTKPFRVEDYCFDKQIAFIRDPSKFKTAVCSRRSGKSVACASDLLETAQNFPNSNSVYITLNRRTAKRIIWKELLERADEYNMPIEIDKTDLTITRTDNKSTIYISGAKDESEIEKFRGMSIKKIYIDEGQAFRPYIKDLVEDVLVPATWDCAGSISLIGTPGPIPVGFFYEAAHSSGWSNYHWTIFDNPHILKKSGMTPEQILAAERVRKGITEDDPTYQREALGLWVRDSNALVYQFNKSKNIYDQLPGNLEYIFGIDIGHTDADAIAVLGFSYDRPEVYLVEEYVKDKSDITTLVQQIEKMRAIYKPIKLVMDAGGLGKKIQEEIRNRHSIPLEAADKKRKFEFISLLNDDLRTGKLKAFSGSIFEEDSYLTQWNRDVPGKLKISDRYHTDIGDAVLYGWRECKHYMFQPKEEKKVLDIDTYMNEMEEAEAEKMDRERKRDPDDPSDVEWDDLI